MDDCMFLYFLLYKDVRLWRMFCAYISFVLVKEKQQCKRKLCFVWVLGRKYIESSYCQDRTRGQHKDKNKHKAVRPSEGEWTGPDTCLPPLGPPTPTRDVTLPWPEFWWIIDLKATQDEDFYITLLFLCQRLYFSEKKEVLFAFQYSLDRTTIMFAVKECRV